MRGLILVNNKNQIVLVEGDNRFRNHLKTLIKRDLCPHSDAASTSSGVFSDSSNEEKPSTSSILASDQPKTVYCLKKFCQNSTVLSEITYHFLPIISIFRTAASMKDTYKSMKSGDSTILFESLNCGFLLLVITEGDENVAIDWQRVASESLKLHFGPLLESLDADLSVYDCAISQLGTTLDNITKHLPIKRDTAGYRAATFYANDSKRMIPLLKSLTERLADTLGTNREALPFSCLLVSKGEFLASVNSTSEDKKIWKHFHSTDINALKRFLKLHPLTTNTQVNQLWLRSKSSETPFYTDVMRYRIVDDLEIVFVCAATGCALIRMGAEVLEQLDNLIYENSDTLKTCLMLKKLCCGLRNTTARSHCRTPTAFLRNPPKTADFIENVWERILNELKNLSVESNELTVQSSGTRSRSTSLFSMKSAFSMMSMSTSMETCCGKEKLLPPKLETIIRYLRRQVLSLVQELCSSAQADALSERLPTAHAIIAQSLTRTHLIAIHKLKIGDEDRMVDLRDHLKPTTWRLDMLAYELVDSQTEMSIPYIPDKLIEPFAVFSDHSSTLCASFKLNGQAYYGVQVQIYEDPTGVRQSIFGRMKSKKSEPIFVLRTLYDGFVNPELAHKQTQALALYLKPMTMNLRNLFS